MTRMRIFSAFLFYLFLFSPCNWSQDSISLHVLEVDFEYGSRPTRKCKETESHYFGGLHGGHVSIILDGKSYGFMPASPRVHIFPKKKKASIFTFQYRKESERTDSVGIKTLTIKIPISELEFNQIDSIVDHYVEVVPYDYAFFGMRCASSTREILGQLGIMKKRNNASYVLRNFFPKRLRKKLIRLAKERDYQMITTNGRDCRKWEKD